MTNDLYKGGNRQGDNTEFSLQGDIITSIKYFLFFNLKFFNFSHRFRPVLVILTNIVLLLHCHEDIRRVRRHPSRRYVLENLPREIRIHPYRGIQSALRNSIFSGISILKPKKCDSSVTVCGNSYLHTCEIHAYICRHQ